MTRRGPLDPRLVRRSKPVRRFVATAIALGLLATASLVLQAILLGRVISRAFAGHASLGSLTPQLTIVVGLALVRAATSWAQDAISQRTAVTVKSRLRADMVDAILALGPSGSTGRPAGELAVTAVRGLDALDGYFSLYLPQLFVAATAPIAIMAWVASFDLLSAASIAAVVAAIPVFGILLGLAAKHRAEKQWAETAAFAGHFLDVIQGLPTLRALGRAKAQAEGVEKATDSLRRRTMSTLRVAFLSAFALELLAAIGTALVAVTLALRMIHGSVALGPALAVLIVTPEVFVPLRQASAQFHASAEGLAALETSLDLVERAEQAAAKYPATPARMGVDSETPSAIVLDSVSVTYPGRDDPALEQIDLRIEPGERILLVGPSGAGKSTLLKLLLGFQRPTGGRLLIDGIDLADLDLEEWRRHVAWVPQRPHLFATTVADNIALGRPGTDMREIAAAAESAGATDFISQLPNGFQTVLGENGASLSGGERQRIALARAFVRNAPILILDEPSASLDDNTESIVRDAVRDPMRTRTVIVASHRPAWTEDLGRVVAISSGRVVSDRAFEAVAP